MCTAKLLQDSCPVLWHDVCDMLEVEMIADRLRALSVFFPVFLSSSEGREEGIDLVAIGYSTGPNIRCKLLDRRHTVQLRNAPILGFFRGIWIKAFNASCLGIFRRVRAPCRILPVVCSIIVVTVAPKTPAKLRGIATSFDYSTELK